MGGKNKEGASSLLSGWPLMRDWDASGGHDGGQSPASSRIWASYRVVLIFWRLCNSSSTLFSSALWVQMMLPALWGPIVGLQCPLVVDGSTARWRHRWALFSHPGVGGANSNTQSDKIPNWDNVPVFIYLFIPIFLLLLCGCSWWLGSNKLMHFLHQLMVWMLIFTLAHLKKICSEFLLLLNANHFWGEWLNPR